MKIGFKSVYVGALIGSIVALFVSTIPTAIDWHINPSGIFHSQTGTNWPIVFETLFSWFWPVAIVSTLFAVIIHAYIKKHAASHENP